jgi:hypothetical protein
MHGGFQPSGAGRRTKKLGHLLSYLGVPVTGSGDHVQDTLPDLIKTIEPRAASALE